jgi:ABC-type glutathione transport system ATPase component
MVHGELTAIRVTGLNKSFRKADGTSVHALRDLDLHVGSGECVSVIGESGSGKSTLARILMGLESPDTGSVEIAGHGLAGHGPASGDGGVAVVLQDPADSLDPRYKVEAAIGEPLTIRKQRLPRDEIRTRVRDAMESVGLGEHLLESRVSRLSGGQQQRVGIARALVTKPSLLILDEPTSALDPSVQAQILDLLQSLQRAERLSVLLITHDLAVAAFMGDRICVLRSGRMLEMGTSDDVWRRSRHPYTRALMAASSFDVSFEWPEAPTSGPVTATQVRPCEFRDICGADRAATCPGPGADLESVGTGHWAVPSCLHHLPPVETQGVST